MKGAKLATGTYDKLMEGALRNLHLECNLDGENEPYSSRILHFDVESETMVIAMPALNGATVRKIPAATSMTCSCRLGRDIMRFSAAVKRRILFQLNGQKRIPALLLDRITAPRIIQRRRYYRVSMARHNEAEMFLWAIGQSESGPEILKEFKGKIVDLSAGGAGLLSEDGKKIKLSSQEEGVQIWAKIILPGENESLIFKVTPRHVKYIAASEMFHVGIEFVEYIDPGKHHNVIDKLVRYVSTQERQELKRTSDRRE